MAHRRTQAIPFEISVTGPRIFGDIYARALALQDDHFQSTMNEPIKNQSFGRRFSVFSN